MTPTTPPLVSPAPPAEGPAERDLAEYRAAGVELDDAVLRERLSLLYDATAENSRKALRQDWKTAWNWCRQHGQVALPMSTETLDAWLSDEARRGKRQRWPVAEPMPRFAMREGDAHIRLPKARATLARYAASIARIHRALELPDPTAGPSWPNRWRRISRRKELSRPQRKAKGLSWQQLSSALADPVALPDTTLNRRDKALVMVMFDGMLRESEVTALRRESWRPAGDGGGTFVIPQSKTDQDGQGKPTRVNPDTVRHLQAWLERSPGRAGPLFAAIPRQARGRSRLRDQVLVPVDEDSAPLAPAAIDAIVRRVVAAAIGDARGFSGHSARIGVCQEMFRLGFPLSRIMDEGRWKSSAMPMRYAEGAEKEHGASADLAKLLGR
jgi:hypothetical protein